MKYTVVWSKAAEEKLANLWLDDEQREQITRATNEIDQRLQQDPQNEGESRENDRRVLIVPPLAVYFRVSVADRVVQVLTIRRVKRRT